jgi:thymidylate synthase
MEQYRDYVTQILNGYNNPPARVNMPSTIAYPSLKMDFDFIDGLPILTGKKMPFYSILGELICFMQGRMDVRDFQNLGCSVWWDNAYNWNIKQKDLKVSMEEYRNESITGVSYNLGTIYSYFWRGVQYQDQLNSIIEGIKKDPYSRYHVIDAWDKVMMTNQYTSQPNCHVYYQVTCLNINGIGLKDIIKRVSNLFDNETASEIITNYTLNKKGCAIAGHLTQRSCDAFLGVPFNITSYSLLTIIVAILTGNLPWLFSWVGVNNHIYSNHIDAVDTYMDRPTYNLPKLHIEVEALKSLKDIENISSLEQLKELFWLVDYKSGEKIPAPLSVGM